MEFRDQSITDILLVLAEASGKSIIPDETVSGNASFLFTDSDFETALSLFLSTYKLHYSKTGNAYYVSRVAASYDKERNLVSLAADGVDVQLLIRALSKAMGMTILYDSLPREALTVNIEAVPPETAIEILIRRFPDYTVDSEAAYRYVRKKPANQEKTSSTKKETAPPITRNEETYSINMEKGRFLETIVALFSIEGKEYSLLTKADAMLENLYFSGRSFDDLLRLLLEQGNADYVVSGGVYYVTELQRRDVIKKLKKTEILTLKHLQAQELPNLLPTELASGNSFRVDKTNNSVILTGSEEETRPIIDFIKLEKGERHNPSNRYVRILRESAGATYNSEKKPADNNRDRAADARKRVR